MKKGKYGTAAVYAICALLTLAAFFAKDFVLYDFQMMPANYNYIQSTVRPVQATTSFWFAFGQDRELQYGYADDVDLDTVNLYGKTEVSVEKLTSEDMIPIREDLIGYFVAALPVQQEDIDGDGIVENVYDFARADIGPHTYELAPREFRAYPKIKGKVI